MTDRVRAVLACLNILAGIISVVAIIISTRANRRAKKALEDIQEQGRKLGGRSNWEKPS
jgi:hypothetical protein